MTALSDVLGEFPRERRWLLPALQAVQHARGWLAPDALAAVAAHLRVPASEVWGVATDYPELRVEPTRAHLVRVCTGVSCRVLGGVSLLGAVRERFAHADVTVEEADCVFTCSMAPLVEVDGACHGRVTRDDVDRLERWFTSGLTVAVDASAPRCVGDGSSSTRVSGAVPGRNATSVRRDAAPGSAGATLDALVRDARARASARPPMRLLVGMGSCGRSVAAGEVFDALTSAAARRSGDVSVTAGACNGMCYAAPTVEVHGAGRPRVVLERVAPADAGRLLQALESGRDVRESGFGGVVWTERPWRGLVPAEAHPFWRHQERLLLRRVGAIDPDDLDDALLAGAYCALARALDGPPERVIDEVKAAGLQGRGGAFFPTAVKWEACRRGPGSPKYVVLNGEEGEPGIFKDRHLMEGDPHQVLEGVLLAAYAAGASHAILYVHGEAHVAAARLARAVAAAEAAGIVGERTLGGAPGCTVELRRGAGGFVLGEETALLESIEGRRAQPRTRPPFPVESGLWGRPTVINNVETLAAIPAILEGGGAAFLALGTAAAPGTKVFGLSGPIARPGVVEVRNGVTLRRLLVEIGGGVPDTGFLGAVVGGPSGSLVPAARFDVPMEPRGLVSPGTGGIVGVPESASVADVVTTLLAFNARESCGKCTPCREGAPRLLAMLDELDLGSEPDRARLRQLAETMQLASLCGLGQAAPLAVLRALDDFPSAFSARAGKG